MPTGYRPTIRLDFPLVGGGYRQYTGDAYISTNGVITAYADQTSSYWGVLIYPLTEAP